MIKTFSPKSLIIFSHDDEDYNFSPADINYDLCPAELEPEAQHGLDYIFPSDHEDILGWPRHLQSSLLRHNREFLLAMKSV